MTLYRCVSRWVLGPVLRKLYVINVHGAENLPLTGGSLVMINHQRGVDPFVVGVSLPRDMRFAAKKELFENLLWRLGLRSVGAYPVPRGDTPANIREFIDRSINLARSGFAVAIFPEGTRPGDGELHRPKRGALVIIIRSGCPVSLAGVVFTDPPPLEHPTKLKRLRHRFVRTRIDIWVSEPLHFPSVVDSRLPIPSTMIKEVSDRLIAEMQKLTGQAYNHKYARSAKR